MAEFPFKIPKSLATYAEQFDDDPLAATTKLKKQLQNRGPDAVGYFLLAWFYHLKGVKEQAVQNALKAKIYAPGSPLMEKLHYYLSHPAAFDAWTPQQQGSQSSQKYRSQKGPEPVLDLDNLIARLSEVDSDPISVPESTKDSTDGEPAKPLYPEADEEEDEIENIASETLAKIHEMQGKTQAAINTYKRLKKLNKDKKEYYKEQIERLEQQREESDEEE